MNIYHDKGVWICEADMRGRKYIGEALDWRSAETQGFQWQCSVLDQIEVENERANKRNDRRMD